MEKKIRAKWESGLTAVWLKQDPPVPAFPATQSPPPSFKLGINSSNGRRKLDKLNNGGWRGGSRGRDLPQQPELRVEPLPQNPYTQPSPRLLKQEEGSAKAY